MARKKKLPEHANHERWLVSYADFMTLLFAFFVVMFAVSQVDTQKVGRFTESFSKAVGVDMFPQPGRGLIVGSTDGTIEEHPDVTLSTPLPPELLDLEAALAMPETREEVENVQISQRRNELVLRLSDGVLFESGNDALEERAARVIARLASELRRRAVTIRIEGHTDDRPIRTARFRSNWDLSTARATAVVARFAAEGIDPPRLSAAGYGEFHPIATNATDEGRKQNRRVDIVVSAIPQTDAPTTPRAKPTTKDVGVAAPAPSKEQK